LASKKLLSNANIGYMLKDTMVRPSSLQ